MNKQANQADWAELIQDYRSSGLSMATWCRNNGLKTHQLTYRLQKAKQQSAKEQTTWLPVDLNSESSLTIKIGPYAVIIKEDFDPVLLKKLVVTLSSL